MAELFCRRTCCTFGTGWLRDRSFLARCGASGGGDGGQGIVASEKRLFFAPSTTAFDRLAPASAKDGKPSAVSAAHSNDHASSRPMIGRSPPDQAIRIAYWEVRKANLLPWSALTRLGPQLNGSGGYSRSGTTTSTVSQNFNITSGASANTLNFDQPLFDLTVFPAYRLGKLTAQAKRLQHQYQIRVTLYSVTTAYYTALKDQQLVKVDRQTVDLARQQFDVAQKHFIAGDGLRSDVLKAQAAVEASCTANAWDRGKHPVLPTSIPWPIFSICRPIPEVSDGRAAQLSDGIASLRRPAPAGLRAPGRFAGRCSGHRSGHRDQERKNRRLRPDRGPSGLGRGRQQFRIGPLAQRPSGRLASPCRCHS